MAWFWWSTCISQNYLIIVCDFFQFRSKFNQIQLKFSQILQHQISPNSVAVNYFLRFQTQNLHRLNNRRYTIAQQAVPLPTRLTVLSPTTTARYSAARELPRSARTVKPLSAPPLEIHNAKCCWSESKNGSPTLPPKSSL